MSWPLAPVSAQPVGELHCMNEPPFFGPTRVFAVRV